MQGTKNGLTLAMKILPALSVIPVSISAIYLCVIMSPGYTGGPQTLWGVPAELFAAGAIVIAAPIGFVCFILALTPGLAASQRIWLSAGAAFPFLAWAIGLLMALDDLRHFRA